MKDSTAADRILHLLSEERRERLDVPRILSLLSLRPYLTVADIGCGPGLFTIPLAKSLWDGKVYAVDVEEEMLETVRRRAQEARLGNIVTVKSEAHAPSLKPDSLDGPLVACVLPEAHDSGALVKAVVEALRRGGWCAVIEWQVAAEGGEGPPQEHRIAEEEVVRLAKDAGMRLTMRRDLNSSYYMVVFIK